jgi:hypothetical protein
MLFIIMRSSVVDRVNNYRHHHHHYDVIRSTKITLHYYHPPADWLSLIDKKKELYDKLMTFFIYNNKYCRYHQEATSYTVY